VQIVADESVLGYVVRALRADGHTVEYISETAPGSPDPNILDRAAAMRAVLLTADKDFGELVIRLRRASHGVVLYRLADLSREGQIEAVLAAFRDFGDQLRDSFAVVVPGTVRLRPLDTPPGN
jgi:predicted nuclease of predicted toxin-antitoxin system